MFIVIGYPIIDILLQLVKGIVNLFSKGHPVEFIENGFVESFADTIGLGAARLGLAMNDIFHRQIKLIFMMLTGATILALAM